MASVKRPRSSRYKQYPVYSLDDDDDDYDDKHKYRERNRIAAQRSRAKKRQEEDEQKKMLDVVSDANEGFRADIDVLMATVDTLSAQLITLGQTPSITTQTSNIIRKYRNEGIPQIAFNPDPSHLGAASGNAHPILPAAAGYPALMNSAISTSGGAAALPSTATSNLFTSPPPSHTLPSLFPSSSTNISQSTSTTPLGPAHTTNLLNPKAIQPISSRGPGASIPSTAAGAGALPRSSVSPPSSNTASTMSIGAAAAVLGNIPTTSSSSGGQFITEQSSLSLSTSVGGLTASSLNILNSTPFPTSSTLKLPSSTAAALNLSVLGGQPSLISAPKQPAQSNFSSTPGGAATLTSPSLLQSSNNNGTGGTTSTNNNISLGASSGLPNSTAAASSSPLNSSAVDLGAPQNNAGATAATVGSTTDSNPSLFTSTTAPQSFPINLGISLQQPAGMHDLNASAVDYTLSKFSSVPSSTTATAATTTTATTTSGEGIAKHPPTTPFPANSSFVYPFATSTQPHAATTASTTAAPSSIVTTTTATSSSTITPPGSVGGPSTVPNLGVSGTAPNGGMHPFSNIFGNSTAMPNTIPASVSLFQPARIPTPPPSESTSTSTSTAPGGFSSCNVMLNTSQSSHHPAGNPGSNFFQSQLGSPAAVVVAAAATTGGSGATTVTPTSYLVPNSNLFRTGGASLGGSLGSSTVNLFSVHDPTSLGNSTGSMTSLTTQQPLAVPAPGPAKPTMGRPSAMSLTTGVKPTVFGATSFGIPNPKREGGNTFGSLPFSSGITRKK